MKIGLLSFEFPPETGFGGIGTYTWYQARALARLGHEVHVIAGLTSPAPELQHLREDGVNVWRFRSAGRAMNAFKALGRRRLWWSQNRLENAVSMYEALRALRRRHHLDVIEMPECGAEGFLVNYLSRIPAVIKFHSPASLIMPTYDIRRADPLLCSAIERTAMFPAAAFMSASRFLANEVASKLGVRRRIAVVPNGIDLRLFDNEEPIDARRKFNLSADRLMIFFSGRMERRKGIHLCLEIVPAILEKHDVEIVFAGQDLFDVVSSSLLPSLRGRSLRGTFKYLGKLDLRDVRACLRAADIFLFPSLWENCPYSCLEAMAAGRAIVCSDAGGLPELIRHRENGLLARSEQPAAFIAALDELIADRALRERLGAAARRTVEHSFSDETIARQSLAVYRQCVGAVA